jgi:beta-ureidopropionase / N-carbamoyl-L-amino-acid hydrolase
MDFRFMDFQDYRIQPERLKEDFDALAQIGATPAGGVHRLALSHEDVQARTWFATRAEEDGFLLRDDEAGNLSAVHLSSHPRAKTLLLGSHLDSVPNGGKYDGAIGVLAALEVLRVVKENNITLPVHLEAINFTDEEGCWQGLFGSKAFTGKLAPLKDSDYETREKAMFRAALLRTGINPAEVHCAERSSKHYAGYIELHIEQGAQLYKQQAEIGIVTTIVGRTTYEIKFYGEASHSGTTDPENRRDALFAASDFISQAHRTLTTEGGVFNCGNLVVEPGAFNIIPNLAVLTVECRHPDEKQLERLEETMLRLADHIAGDHKLRITSRKVVHMPAAPMSDQVRKAIEQACHQVGVTKSLHLTSYAGHDAQMMSLFTPTGMIFIPSYKGISHNPNEYSDWEHVVQGANVLLQTVLLLATGSMQEAYKGVRSKPKELPVTQ